MPLIRHANGRYYLRLQVGGKRHFLSTGYKDLKRAGEKAHQLERKLRAAEDGQRWTPTVGDWWQTYEKTYSAAKSPGGERLDRWVLEPFVEVHRARKMDSVSPADCQAWVNRLKKDYAQNTVRMAMGVLGAFFNKAVREGHLRTSPWKGVVKPPVVPRTRVLSREEQARLVPRLLPRYATLVRFILATGLREGEVLNIRSGHVQDDGLHVVGKRGKQRVVPLTKEARALLPLPKVGKRQFNKAVEKGCAGAKIPHTTIHDLRRTFGTRCATAGMPVPTLAKIMGHTSVQTTLQYYIHVDNADALKALERANPSGEVIAFPLPQSGIKG
jgi:integrase